MNRQNPAVETISIVGVGQMGGSIGMAALAQGLAQEVIGVTRREQAIEQALARGAITRGTTVLAEGVADADLVVVCTPVALIADCVLQAAGSCRAGTLITDAGSTKAAIVAAVAGRLPAGVEFIGSHPLAGNHESGVAAARADLYQGQMVLLTPDATSTPTLTNKLERFWRRLGAHVRTIDPVTHDQVLAVTSHLLHVVAPAVAATTPREYLDCVAGGWRDGTRVAAADCALWEEILLSNAGPTIAAIDAFSEVVEQFRTALTNGDRDQLAQLLRKGKQHRDALGS